MTAPSSPATRYQRMLVFRRRNVPTQVLRVLEDADGWCYVVNLADTLDFGPYVKAEIASVFDVESEPCAVLDLGLHPPGGGGTEFSRP